jgi:hypothetical protein
MKYPTGRQSLTKRLDMPSHILKQTNWKTILQ